MLSSENAADKFVPEEIIEQIDRVIESRKHGYESRPEFIKDAVRRRLEDMKTLAK